MTKIIAVESMLDVDFEALSAKGIVHLQTDIESTLAPYNVCEVDPWVNFYLDIHKTIGNIATTSLITNKTDLDFVESIACQLGPDTAYFTPHNRSERKPSASLIERAAEHAGASRDSIVVVGDKLSADMKAARRAGVAAGYWVERLGKQDLIFDRLIRRPLEKPFRQQYEV